MDYSSFIPRVKLFNYAVRAGQRSKERLVQESQMGDMVLKDGASNLQDPCHFRVKMSDNLLSIESTLFLFLLT